MAGHDDHSHPEHASGHHDDHHHVHFDDAKTVARTEHEGQALSSIFERAVDSVADAVAAPPRLIVDLGCGPGVATGLLAQRFPAAVVIGADGSPLMLARAAARAAEAGLDDRVTTLAVELPAGVDDLPTADLLWASMVLHHVGDEAAMLTRLRARLAPRGLLALVEHAAPIELVTDDGAADAALWTRIGSAWSAWFTQMRAGLPDATESADHAAMLGAAGFSVVSDEVLALEVDPRLDEPSRRFVVGQLVGTSQRLADHLTPEDTAAVARLADDPTGVDMGAVRLCVSRRVLLAHPSI